MISTYSGIDMLVEERWSFQQMALEQLVTLSKNISSDLNTKSKSKWIRELNIKHKTVKLLKDHISENLHDSGLCEGL